MAGGTGTVLTVLSLGAGVQSSTLALMAAEGDLPRPDCAIFADTGCEPRPVYEWLDYLTARLPYPVYRVQEADGLLAGLRRSLAGRRFASLPAYTESERDGGGRLRRQCTREYKVEPITRRIRGLLDLRPGQRVRGVAVTLWIGISLDEVVRMKPNRTSWIQNAWPLIDLRMTRTDCIRWLTQHGYPTPPKSSCVICPYHDNRYWRWLRDEDGEGWQTALDVDQALRGGLHGTRQRVYLHRSLRPLGDVDLSTPEERGQLGLWEHAEECAGVCFV